MLRKRFLNVALMVIKGVLARERLLVAAILEVIDECPIILRVISEQKRDERRRERFHVWVYKSSWPESVVAFKS